MKTITTASAIALAFMITACGSEKKAPDPAPTAAAKTAPAPKKAPAQPKTAEEVKVFHENFETAMTKIPPELREPFQKLFGCEVAKNNKLPAAQQVLIDGDWVVRKTAELKQNPSLANCSA